MSIITLNDVAKKAGVSVSTASRALNRVEGAIALSEQTINRVKAAAVALGYTPNAGARMLRTGRSRTLGILGSDPRFFKGFRVSSFVGEAMAGLIDGAVGCGHHLSLLTGIEQAPEDGRQMPDLGIVDGLLIFNRDLQADRLYAPMLEKANIPVVYALDYHDDSQSYVLSPDDVAGGKLATEYLLKAGHRRIGFVRKHYYKGIFDRREAGWRAALQGAGIRPEPSWIFEDEPATQAQLQAAALDAAVCCNDPIAYNFRQQLQSLGMGPLALIRISHLLTHPPEHPDFAQVGYPLAEVAASAVRTLVDLIEGRSCARHQFFPYAFSPGSSFPQGTGQA